MTPIDVFYVVVLLLTSIAIGGLAFLYFFRRRYTRERFAFCAFLAITSLAVTFVTVMIAGGDMAQLVVALVYDALDREPPAVQASLSDKVLALIAIFGLMFCAIFLHKNWRGEISTIEYERSLIGLSPSVVGGTFAALQHIWAREQFEVYSHDTRQREDELRLTPAKPKAWHLQVAKLLGLISRQYYVDTEKDWYDERRIFISEFGKSKRALAVLCVDCTPTEESLQEFVSFVARESSRETRFVAAVQGNGVQQKVTLSVNCDSRGRRPNESSSRDVWRRKLDMLLEEEAMAVDASAKFKLKEDIEEARRMLSEDIFHPGDTEVQIEIRFESEMLDSLVDLEPYRQDISKRYESNPIAPGYTLALRDVYTPSRGFYRGVGKKKIPIEDVEKDLLEWSRQPGFTHVALLGEYGQGKSVLALKIAYELLHNQQADERIPVLIELRGRSPRTQTTLGILAEWAAPYGINPQSILMLHEAGRIVLLFDAFDEMDLVGESGMRFDNFRRIWEFALDPNSKILITGRPNFFLDERERVASLNEVQRTERGPRTKSIYLEPFVIEQTRLALARFDSGICDGMCDFLESGNASQTFVDLVSRPSTLFLAANIWSELKTSESINDINSAMVIRKFIDHCYERQQAKYPDAFLSIIEREYFMVGIADGMFVETQYANSLENTKLVETTRRLLDSFPDALTQFEPATEKRREPLRNRLRESHPVRNNCYRCHFVWDTGQRPRASWLF